MNYRLMVLIFCSGFITACDAIYGNEGYFRNRNYDYVNAINNPVLRIPPPLTAANISDQYNIQTDPHYNPPSLLPPGSLAWQIEHDRTTMKKPGEVPKRP